MPRIYRILNSGHSQATAFLDYCKLHGKTHDESYIPGQDWVFGNDNPSFILEDSTSTIVGVAGFLASPSFRIARKARVAILHALEGAGPDAYSLLSQAAFGLLRGDFDECYLFIPEILTGTIVMLEKAGFIYDRSVYLMEARLQASKELVSGADNLEQTKTGFPVGYSCKHLDPQNITDLEAFIKVRNRNFRKLKGSIDARVDDLRQFAQSPEYLPGGLILMFSPEGLPCGTLRLEHDEEEDAGFVGTISVDTEHRGRGLGRALVRYSQAQARRNGFKRLFLAVNTDNRRALDLYLSEGFSIVKAMNCMVAPIPAPTPV